MPTWRMNNCTAGRVRPLHPFAGRELGNRFVIGLGEQLELDEVHTALPGLAARDEGLVLLEEHGDLELGLPSLQPGLPEPLEGQVVSP